MDKLTYDKLTEIQGRMEAEMIESFLEAHEIDVELIQESIGHSIYPVTIDGLGCVQIFVPKDKILEARSLLKDFRDGLEQDEE